MSILNRISSVFQKNETVLKSPLKGTVVPLAQVPDETFASKILGDGVAIDPLEGILLSPVDGEVVQVFRTNHAVGLLSASGLEILLHVGIDTVKMNGEGFRALVKPGQKVKAGDRLLEFDLGLVKAKAKSAITPMVVTNMEVVKNLENRATGAIEAGQELLRVETKA